jgi:hypothetical protein
MVMDGLLTFSFGNIMLVKLTIRGVLQVLLQSLKIYSGRMSHLFRSKSI